MIGVDLTDFSRFNNERFSSFVCDQSKPDERQIGRRPSSSRDRWM